MTGPLSELAKSHRREMRATYERAYEIFLDKLEIAAMPKNFPLPYGLCDEVSAVLWLHMPMVDQLVAGELSETINQLNAWCEWLLHLTLWTDVLDHFGEQDAWTIQRIYVDPLAQICLTQPSSVRDRFGYIATNAIHQANLSSIDGYKDRLLQDEHKGAIRRTDREGQVKSIGACWTSTSGFIHALASLDTKTYRVATRNYRNLASHAIAPRFRFGVTGIVSRARVPIKEKVERPDGTCIYVEHPTKKCISYAFGGTEALDLREVYTLSYHEYDRAVRVFNAYGDLLRELIAALPRETPTAAG